MAGSGHCTISPLADMAILSIGPSAISMCGTTMRLRPAPAFRFIHT